MSTKKKGFVNVEYIKDLGSNVKGTKEVRHAEIADNLAKKGFVKILDKVEKYVPKKAKPDEVKD